jgi:hypothetical protein
MEQQQSNPTRRMLPSEVVARLRADLEAAKPLASLPVVHVPLLALRRSAGYCGGTLLPRRAASKQFNRRCRLIRGSEHSDGIDAQSELDTRQPVVVLISLVMVQVGFARVHKSLAVPRFHHFEGIERLGCKARAPVSDGISPGDAIHFGLT